ncbi:MAG: acyl carrier protein [Leptolyngbyaceae cyanobacterium SL_5_9]|nr:acyl carrier protein [Leptolyngbyaceae cyanobacterium SL_5_9]NJO75070.1 acyl carrier protein [Leptolyngbyaceae cyanobacterium RM1_406_9]
MEIALEMPMAMKQNEVVLFINLASVQHQDPVKTLNTLQEMGYTPELKLYRWKTDEKERVDACALLHREVSDDPESVFSQLELRWDELVNTFGSGSVFLVMGSDE